MAKLLGNNYRVFIESTTQGTFHQIAGQQDVSLSGSQSFANSSTKDTGAYATKVPTQRDSTLTLALRPDLPDANGFGRLESVANAATQVPVGIQIRKAPFADGDVVFEASMFVGEFSKSMPQNDVVSASVSFGLEAAPTTDLLS